VFGLFVWFLFSAPLVFCVGFCALLIAVRVPFGRFVVPPIVGAASGFLIAKLLYRQGTVDFQLLHLTGIGVCTALVAALIYFWPRTSGVEA
jgi:hypothetical protein